MITYRSASSCSAWTSRRETSANPYRYFLWKLLIDGRFQRRGYGTATIDAVVDLLRDHPDADALFTSAVAGPASPVTLYERYGFVRTGEIFDDEIVLRLDLPARRRTQADRH